MRLWLLYLVVTCGTLARRWYKSERLEQQNRKKARQLLECRSSESTFESFQLFMPMETFDGTTNNTTLVGRLACELEIAHSKKHKAKQQRWRTRPIWALAGRRSTPTMPMTKVRLYPCVVMHWLGPHLFIPLSVLFSHKGRARPDNIALAAFELLHDFLACKTSLCMYYASTLSRIALVSCPNHLSHNSIYPPCRH